MVIPQPLTNASRKRNKCDHSLTLRKPSHPTKKSRTTMTPVRMKNPLESEERQPQNQQEAETATAEEPDWDKLAEFEPSKTDVLIFRSATEKHRAAQISYRAALEEWCSAWIAHGEAYINTAADMHSAGKAKMDALVNGIKQDFEGNHRTKVATNERFLGAHERFLGAQDCLAQRWMRRVSPCDGASGVSRRIAEQMQSSITQALPMKETQNDLIEQYEETNEKLRQEIKSLKEKYKNVSVVQQPQDEENVAPNKSSVVNMESVTSPSAVASSCTGAFFSIGKKSAVPAPSALAADRGGVTSDGGNNTENVPSVESSTASAEREVHEERISLTRDAASHRESFLNDAKEMTNRLFHKIDVYAQTVEDVTIHYLRVQDSQHKEAQRLEEFEADVAGVTSHFPLVTGGGASTEIHKMKETQYKETIEKLRQENKLLGQENKSLRENGKNVSVVQQPQDEENVAPNKS